ncbi:MAG: ABC transporter ATP-binding protein [Candidatus Paceibacterota bacterium]
MSKPIIEVRNISKRYDITHTHGGYVALRDVLTTIMRRPFSFLAHKAKRAVGLEKKEEFWALKDVSFAVNRGEVIGVIGANGAGKSTLLKILSQITPPTGGEVILRGRVGSLLEVGTGFHPELTGRENIFLNGAILGMKKQEIAAKFDQIVDFAGIERFLDTPVKHYSSGMYVRLAFSVAAHMEPDILLVDEVLAVGDAEFQKKCLGKMDEITRNEGRTIIFVSHSLNTIRDLCPTTILMKEGRIDLVGPTDEVIDHYQEEIKGLRSIDLRNETRRRGTGAIKLTDFYVENSDGSKSTMVKSGESTTFVLSYECAKPENVKTADVGISINRNGAPIATFYSSYVKSSLSDIATSGQFRFSAENIPLAEGTYGIGARVLANDVEADWPKSEIGQLEVSNPTEFKEKGFRTGAGSAVIINGLWSHIPSK